MSVLRLGLLATFALTAAPAFSAPVTYQLDPTHTDVLFSWNHLGFSHPTGRLTVSEGTLVYDKDKPQASTVAVVLALSELDTHVPKLDGVLKGEKFFDLQRFPDARFKSTTVQAVGKDKLKVSGELTLHGQTRPVVLDVALNGVGEHPGRKVPAIGFNATTQINRSDFGLTGFSPNVGERVDIRITTEALAAGAP